MIDGPKSNGCSGDSAARSCPRGEAAVHGEQEPNGIETIRFPQMRQINTHQWVELCLVGFVCCLVAGVVARLSHILGLLLLLPMAYACWAPLAVGVQNKCIEFAWSRSFARRIRASSLSSLVGTLPSRYVLHARFFRQFDRSRLAPACVIEDTETHEFIAVYPSSLKTIPICRELGVEIAKH